jgi:hypothetical protein
MMLDRLAAAGNNRFARWLADDSFPPRPPDRAVYRYKGLIWFLPVLLAVELAVGVAILVTLRLPRDFAGYVGLPIFLWASTAAVWLGTVTTAVRVPADCLVVDNAVVRHVIPWERLAGLFVEEGAGMLARLDDGTVVKATAFPSTLVDAIKGYDTMRQTLDQVRADCRDARAGRAQASPAPPYRRVLHVPWRPLAGLLIFFEALSWIAFAAHRF